MSRYPRPPMPMQPSVTRLLGASLPSRPRAVSSGDESAGPASLLIYDPAGRLVRTVIEGVQSAGNHTATWNGVDDQGHTVASGIYLVRLQSGTQQDVTKVLLAK